MISEHPLVNWSAFMVLLITRYGVIAGAAFWWYYRFRRERLAYKRIQPKFPRTEDYKREIGYSLLTFGIFATMAIAMFNPVVQPLTRLYEHIADYGVAYYLISIVLMLVLHDAYFYWAHRLMHTKTLYSMVHKVHHLSHNPSPWAAFAFHPIEAVFEFSILPIIVFVIPCHISTIAIFLFVMTAYNVYGHLGYELYPNGFNRHWLGRWLNTSVNHNMHHKFATSNYGLYFTWWDTVLRSTHPKYDETFDEVTSRTTQPIQ